MNTVCSQAPLYSLVSLAQAAPGASADSTGESTPEDRSAEFRAVEGGGDGMSGMTLMVEAYAVFWLLAFALIYVSMRKQTKLDARIVQLQADLSKARADSPAGKTDGDE